MILLAILLFAAPVQAFAYLDPGTMSMIVNVIIGGLVGIVYAIRVFWHNIKSFFANLFGRKKDHD